MSRTLISELEVGKACSLPLIVRSVATKETKTGKPYLSFEFYDGHESVVGQYWDWNGNAIPAKNTVLDVVGKVDTWMGKKQINVKGLNTNKELDVTDFMPASMHDLSATYKEAYALMSEVRNDTLRSIALGLLEDEQARWLRVPGAKQIHHAYVGGTLIHSLSVAKIAKAMAEVVDGADVDLCTVGGFIHDIGKLYTYVVDGVAIEMTDTAIMMDHTFLGARLLDQWAGQNLHLEESVFKLLEMLIHIVLSHHGTKEFGAVVLPLSIEAHIVHRADGIDATAETIRMASKDPESAWTERIYTLGNRPQLSVHHVQSLTTEE